MKKIFLLMAVVMTAFTSFAQEQGKGYRGFAELGYGIGVGDYEFGRFSIETSHGYQFNHYFFLGAGVGFQFSSKYETPGMEYALDKRDSKVAYSGDIHPGIPAITTQFFKHGRSLCA